jgi:hypothetical protein
MKTESILDKPQKQLNPSVWNVVNEQYTLTDEAKSKIENVINWVKENTQLNEIGLNITGSITSNQYSTDSDVDLHFNSPELTEESAKEINKELKDKFISEFGPSENGYIGSHKIEIYFQYNIFQDMMSVGCYDYFNQEWIVGPELFPDGYDPYSEYYNDDMKYVNSIIYDIRNIILEVYESLVVINSSSNDDFKTHELKHLSKLLEKGTNIFISATKFRQIYSSPKSKEEALRKRTSRKWKIADSAFKLLDKFGYLAILKEISTANDLLKTDENPYNILTNILNTIQSSFNKSI